MSFSLSATNSKIIRDWKESNKIVFQTNAIKNLLDMIIRENEDVITVIGSPGCGKTTAIHRVALELHQLHGYDLIPVIYPCQLINYHDPDRKQVFVFDDLLPLLLNNLSYLVSQVCPRTCFI